MLITSLKVQPSDALSWKLELQHMDFGGKQFSPKHKDFLNINTIPLSHLKIVTIISKYQIFSLSSTFPNCIINIFIMASNFYLIDNLWNDLVFIFKKFIDKCAFIEHIL